MPVYNDKAFLVQALDSLLNQSYSNFELIISDDCSSDGSEEICREYAKKDPRIKFIRQEKNIGISRNMIFLLKQAKGDFFMWAANDDLWHKDFIKHLRNILVNDESKVSAFCSMYFIDEQNNQLTSPPPRATDYSGSSAHVRLKKLVTTFDDCFGYGLFRRNTILNIQFPVWKWPNKTCPYNNIYPTLCFHLSAGDFGLYTDEALWFNRLKESENIHHKIPYDNTFLRGFMAFALRKTNLVYESALNIYRASKSIGLVVKSLPHFIYHWCIVQIYNEFRSRLRRYRAGKVKFI